MSRSLVLNATYEPLSVVADKRAVVLVMAGRAETVVESGVVMRSERLRFAVPSIVRLQRYVRVPKMSGKVAPSRRAVFVRDGGECQYCGSGAETIDHVVPRSKGGTHTWGNVVAACRRCNGAKRDRLLADTPLYLARQPRPPTPQQWLLTRFGNAPDDWRPYILGDFEPVAS